MVVVRNISLYIFYGFIFYSFSYYLDSPYLSTFLHDNIITICITLVAITAAVRGLILGKITDLSSSYKDLDFTPTFRELKISVYEQVCMIFLAIFLMIIFTSKKLSPIYLEHIHYTIDSLLTSILLYNVYILKDTATAIIDMFIAIDTKNKSDNSD